jgi:hypothetical protein
MSFVGLILLANFLGFLDFLTVKYLIESPLEMNKYPVFSLLGLFGVFVVLIGFFIRPFQRL